MKIIKGKILVKILPTEVKKISGLTIPDTSNQEGIEKAEVILCDDPDIPCSAGDKLVIYKGSGKEFTNPENNEKNRLISSNEIILIY